MWLDVVGCGSPRKRREMRAQPSCKAKLQEGQKDVSSVLVADLQALEAVEPGERPFNHPPVAFQAVLGLGATAGDAEMMRRMMRPMHRRLFGLLAYTSSCDCASTLVIHDNDAT